MLEPMQCESQPPKNLRIELEIGGEELELHERMCSQVIL